MSSNPPPWRQQGPLSSTTCPVHHNHNHSPNPNQEATGLERETVIRGEVWQYLLSLKPDLGLPPGVANIKATRDLLALPRKRDLPKTWQTRLAQKGITGPKMLRQIASYLV